MYDIVKIYGDSHSNPKDCQCEDKDMHWSIVAENIPHQELRTQYRAGKSIPEICIEASTDLLTYKGRCLFLLALGPLHRIPMYQDGRYAKEIIKPIDPSTGRYTDQSECDQFFDITTPSDTPKKFMGLYHPTLNAARTLQCLSGVLQIASTTKHKILVYNMSKPWQDCGHDPLHPLIRSLWEHVFEHDAMCDMDRSAQKVCDDEGILPWDHETYGIHGHMDKRGQSAWSKVLWEIIKQKGLV
jgi:hypothetical protein